MSWRRRAALIGISVLALSSLTAAAGIDPVNPTCPLNPNWSAYPTMKLTVEKRGGMKVMLAEGRIDPESSPPAASWRRL